MRKTLSFCVPFLCLAGTSIATSITVGTPGNSYLATPSTPSLKIGPTLNFDSLAATTIPAASLSVGRASFSSPGGLTIIPFSTQSSANELFDNEANGLANITIKWAAGTNAFGIGIADSDGVSISLQALNASGNPLGSVFTEILNNTQDPGNPGNSYFEISDTSFDIYGFTITQSSGSANYSGLALDDLQIAAAPEPNAFALFGLGLAAAVCFTLKKRLTSVASTLALLALVAGSKAATAAPVAIPATPIQHVVIIFGENISFDHYFGTYPKAANPPGQPRFTPFANTPAVNGLTPALLTNNPNLNPANGGGATNPFRLNRNQALTADQNHNYQPEQQSFDNGLMDLFPSKTGAAGGTPNTYPPIVNTKGLVMGYYDGNTVTAMWNYAQHFAMSDNSYTTQFGPSTPGVFNLIAGQTNGIIQASALNTPAASFEVADGQGGYTMIGDGDPLNDVCSAPTRFQAYMYGKNVGDLLTANNISWGSFMGGFDLSVINPNGTTGCNRSTASPITGLSTADYIPHHAGFQYWASTANPKHSRPSNAASIGLAGDGANHQYDMHDWFDALKVNNLPAVSILKAPAYQDGHAGYSNPLDEQAFVVSIVNTLEQSPFWNSTAVFILYDDSDGWYDHQLPPNVNASYSALDALNAPGVCGVAGSTGQLPGPNSNGLPVHGRCGYGVRAPLLVVSPWAKPNYVDHTVTDQSSILRFIEDNWGLGRIGGGSFDAIAGPVTGMFDFSQATPQNTAPLMLSPITGLPQ